MVKHTQKIRSKLPTNSLSVFDHFLRLPRKGLTHSTLYTPITVINLHPSTQIFALSQ